MVKRKGVRLGRGARAKKQKALYASYVSVPRATRTPPLLAFPPQAGGQASTNPGRCRSSLNAPPSPLKQGDRHRRAQADALSIPSPRHKRAQAGWCHQRLAPSPLPLPNVPSLIVQVYRHKRAQADAETALSAPPSLSPPS